MDAPAISIPSSPLPQTLQVIDTCAQAHSATCKDRKVDTFKKAIGFAEQIRRTELSLPMFYGMTDAEVQAVISAVNDFA